MKAKKDNLMTLEEFKTKHYGKRGAQNVKSWRLVTKALE